MQFRKKISGNWCSFPSSPQVSVGSLKVGSEYFLCAWLWMWRLFGSLLSDICSAVLLCGSVPRLHKLLYLFSTFLTLLHSEKGLSQLFWITHVCVCAYQTAAFNWLKIQGNSSYRYTLKMVSFLHSFLYAQLWLCLCGKHETDYLAYHDFIKAEHTFRCVNNFLTS